MDLFNSFASSQDFKSIKSIDMHTTGEPTRIVYAGFPDLKGTLLEQREEAVQNYDYLRKRIMLEPRGHFDMYGAILRPDTELVRNGEADMGVLFTHNGGFSTMCGHATIGLGRFLVDTTDEGTFPNRSKLEFDSHTSTIKIRLHAPCGLVIVTVPTDHSGRKSDPSRPVSFLSTPSFAAAVAMEIEIPKELRWEELGNNPSITFDIAYGGAFYVLVSAQELGFTNGLRDINLSAVTSCIKRLKPFLAAHPAVLRAIQHPDDSRLSFLYSVMVVDHTLGYRPDGVKGSETGLCFFADNEIDRSPTGSCVSARIALSHAKQTLCLGEKWAYNSLVSNHFEKDEFIGSIAEIFDDSIIAEVEGYAFYIGTSVFIWETDDRISQQGFVFDKCI